MNNKDTFFPFLKCSTHKRLNVAVVNALDLTPVSELTNKS